MCENLAFYIVSAGAGYGGAGMLLCWCRVLLVLVCWCAAIHVCLLEHNMGCAGVLQCT